MDWHSLTKFCCGQRFLCDLCLIHSSGVRPGCLQANKIVTAYFLTSKNRLYIFRFFINSYYYVNYDTFQNSCYHNYLNFHTSFILIIDKSMVLVSVWCSPPAVPVHLPALLQQLTRLLNKCCIIMLDKGVFLIAEHSQFRIIKIILVLTLYLAK